MRSTHTYVTMHVSKATLEEITKLLTEVGYTHCLHDEGITLDGVMLVHDEEQQAEEDLRSTVRECIEACKENGHWVNATENLTDRELAEDMLEKTTMPTDDVDRITKEIIKVRADLIAKSEEKK